MMKLEELEDEVYGLACAVGSLQADMAELRKGIVRCRDCKWSRIHDGNSYPGNRHEEYVGKTYCIAWGDGMQGEWTNPNGYCHRGERRDA